LRKFKLAKILTLAFPQI